MIYALLAAVVIQPVVVGIVLRYVLAHLAAKDTAHAELVAAKDRAYAEQVATLCQRLQAPEVAVIQHQQETSEAAGTVSPMTDQEYEADQEHLRQALAEIERVEREGILP